MVISHDRVGCQWCGCRAGLNRPTVGGQGWAVPEASGGELRAVTGRAVTDVALPGDQLPAKPPTPARRTGRCGRCGKYRHANTEFFVHDLRYERQFYVCQRCGRYLRVLSGFRVEPAGGG